MVGPGLFFALAVAGGLPLHAESAVGLEARGVDPLVALDVADRLDVRDELGRPVSARLITAQLKQAQVKAASDAAYSSVLPQAAAMAAVLNMLEALRLALRGAPAAPAPQRLFALPLSPRDEKRSAADLPLVCCLALAVVAAALNAPRSPLLAIPARSPNVLRC